MMTHSSILAWKIPMDRVQLDYSPWGPKELDMTEQIHFHFLFIYLIISISTDSWTFTLFLRL